MTDRAQDTTNAGTLDAAQALDPREVDAKAVSKRLMKKAGIDVRVCKHIWSGEQRNG